MWCKRDDVDAEAIEVDFLKFVVRVFKSAEVALDLNGCAVLLQAHQKTLGQGFVHEFGVAANLLEVALSRQMELLLLVELLPEEVLAKFLELETKRRKSEVSVQLVLPDRLVTELDMQSELVALDFNQECIAVLVSSNQKVLKKLDHLVLAGHVELELLPLAVFELEEHPFSGLVFETNRAVLRLEVDLRDFFELQLQSVLGYLATVAVVVVDPNDSVLEHEQGL